MMNQWVVGKFLLYAHRAAHSETLECHKDSDLDVGGKGMRRCLVQKWAFVGMGTGSVGKKMRSGNGILAVLEAGEVEVEEVYGRVMSGEQEVVGRRGFERR